MADTTSLPGTSLVPTGQVTVCCGLHEPGDWGSCCGEECLPSCCERCANCPVVAIETGIAELTAITRAVIRNLP